MSKKKKEKKESKPKNIKEKKISKEEEYLTGWKRTLADFENYKRRQEEDRKIWIKQANQGLILDVLPILDNFEASLEHVPEDKQDDSWVQGITYIKKQLEEVLERNGISEIEVREGDEFDASIHEALENTNKEGKKESNKVKKVIQKGYKLDGRIIRPTKVIVG